MTPYGVYQCLRKNGVEKMIRSVVFSVSASNVLYLVPCHASTEYLVCLFSFPQHYASSYIVELSAFRSALRNDKNTAQSYVISRMKGHYKELKGSVFLTVTGVTLWNASKVGCRGWRSAPGKILRLTDAWCKRTGHGGYHYRFGT